MSRAEKLLERMRRTSEGWGQDDLDKLYRGFGFDVREGGKHRIYTHPLYPDLRDIVARHDNLHPEYTRDAVKTIDELASRTKGQTNE